MQHGNAESRGFPCFPAVSRRLHATWMQHGGRSLGKEKPPPLGEAGAMFRAYPGQVARIETVYTKAILIRYLHLRTQADLSALAGAKKTPAEAGVRWPE